MDAPRFRMQRGGSRHIGPLLLWLATPLLLAGCASAARIEPAAPPGPLPGVTAAVQSQPPALPTAAPTLAQPPTPTAAALDPAGQATAAINATREAALSPPTPAITLPAASPTPMASEPPAANEPLPTPSGIYSWTLKVPILMYHYISEPPADADEYRLDLSVTPDMFRRQLSFLKENGYTTVDLYDLTFAIVNQGELPEKPIILTFDDGYVDNYENAFPILKEFGFEGTFFIVTEFLDTGREGYVTWPMIEEMARDGQRIESHSRTHPDLTEKTHDGLVWEILGAQETLAAHIGYRPRYFCYPGGDYNEETIQFLRELDYWGALTTANGTWHGFNNRFEWERVRVRNSTTLEEFSRLVDLEGTVRGKPPG